MTLNNVNFNVTVTAGGQADSNFRIKGTLPGGVWSAATHTVTFTNATGVDLYYGTTRYSVLTTTAPLKDPLQTLTLA